MSKFKSGDYVVPSSQIVTYDVKMKNYLGRVLQVTTVHEKEYYGSVQAGIPGKEAWGWNPHDLRFATAEEIAASKKPKPFCRGDLVLYREQIGIIHNIDSDGYWVAALTGDGCCVHKNAKDLMRIGSVRKKIKRIKKGMKGGK